MAKTYQFESLAFRREADGCLTIEDQAASLQAHLPEALWQTLAALSPAELAAVRDGVAGLLAGGDPSSNEAVHAHDADALLETDEPDADAAFLEAPPLVPGPLLVAGREVPVPGAMVVTFASHPTRVPRATDGRLRRAHESVVGIVVHTVHGKLGPLREGSKASTRALSYARYQATTPREVSWHLTVDTDGTIVQSADTGWLCWHAGHVNTRTVGIELVQDRDGSLYTAQLTATVALLEVLCRELGVARATPVREGRPYAGLLLPDDIFPGVYGHRNVWTVKNGRKVPVRGAGDPGDPIFDALLSAGFLGVTV